MNRLFCPNLTLLALPLLVWGTIATSAQATTPQASQQSPAPGVISPDDVVQSMAVNALGSPQQVQKSFQQSQIAAPSQFLQSCAQNCTKAVRQQLPGLAEGQNSLDIVVASVLNQPIPSRTVSTGSPSAATTLTPSGNPLAGIANSSPSPVAVAPIVKTQTAPTSFTSGSPVANVQEDQAAAQTTTLPNSASWRLEEAVQFTSQVVATSQRFFTAWQQTSAGLFSLGNSRLEGSPISHSRLYLGSSPSLGIDRGWAWAKPAITPTVLPAVTKVESKPAAVRLLLSNVQPPAALSFSFVSTQRFADKTDV